MTKNKVSVLLPFYNRANYLVSSIDSVIAQTYQNWELLLSDNCSTDGSSELAQEYVARDSRIRYWLNETNIGCVPNYNLCMEKIEGDLIVCFGADDIFKSECLQKFVDVFANDDTVALVTSARDVIDSLGQVTTVERAFTESIKIDGREAIRKLMESLENWIVAPVMFRSKDKAAGFDTNIKLYADIDYWTDILENGDAMYIDENLFQYRIHAGSRTTEVYEQFEFFNDILRLVEKKKSHLLTANSDLSLSAFIVDLLIRLTLHATGGNNYDSDKLLTLEHVNVEEVMRNCDQDNYLVKIHTLARDANDLKRVAALALVGLSTLDKDAKISKAESKQFREALEGSQKAFDEMHVACAWADGEVNKLRDKVEKEREAQKVMSEAYENLKQVRERKDRQELTLRAENESLKARVQAFENEQGVAKTTALNRIAKLLKR